MPPGAVARIAALSLVLAALGSERLRAQADSAAQPHLLDEYVVVGHRTPTVLRESVGATTVLDRSTLESLPARTLADALQYVPGLTFVSRDGTGELPMGIARGFFGGGETDYVLLTVDGVPMNDLRTGLVEWTQLSLAEVDRIEVLRGGASAAYGDAALGAVVNVITTRGAPARRLTGGFEMGDWGDRALQASVQEPLGSDRFGLGMRASRVDGFRSHARGTTATLAASYSGTRGEHAPVYAGVSVQRLRNQEPGPLTPGQLAEDPRQHNPLFASDDRRRDLVELRAGMARPLGPGGLQADARVRLVDEEQTRTLPLAPDAGDTQFHDARSWEGWARLQTSQHWGRSTVVAGVDAEWGRYDSRYADPVDRDAVRSRGEGRRLKLGLHAELQQQLAGRLRAVAGLRFDVAAYDGAGIQTASTRFHQVSPRVGLNFAYARNESHTGNVYISWTRSFKAPTAYQLYDVRLIPSGVPDTELNLSNPGLRPQHSSGVEVGVYHTLALWGDHAYADLALSAYRMGVSDEIDFDLSTFKYGNILESRHDGLEASLTTHLTPSLSLRHAVTLMRVAFRSGGHVGKRLKSIPETVATSALHASLGGGIQGTVTHRFFGGIFLDDANLERLPGHHSIDAMLSVSVGAVRLHLAGVDLADSRAPVGGFLVHDPVADADVRVVYPGGGRHLRGGVTIVP
jgi:outer membrane cobalamin receptor